MLSCFAAYLARSVRPATISVYLSAVRNAHLEQGFDDPFEDTWLLGRVMKGIQRCHGTEVIRPRLPITMPILRELIDACRMSHILVNHDKLLYQAAMLLAFFGFLRCAEFTNSLTRDCVQLTGGNMQVLLRTSKTDPFGKGVTVEVGAATPPYCPVRAMAIYLCATCHESPTQHLFTLSNRQHLTRETFTATIRHLLGSCKVPNSHNYSGHSFRIGAATTAAIAGVPDSLIRAAGRWKSDACLRYIRTPASSKRELSAKLSSVTDGL